jgi:hypothetical protein
MWSCQTKVFAPDGSADDAFGVGLGIYSTVAMIGSYLDDAKAADAGMTIITML